MKGTIKHSSIDSYTFHQDSSRAMLFFLSREHLVRYIFVYFCIYISIHYAIMQLHRLPFLNICTILSKYMDSTSSKLFYCNTPIYIYIFISTINAHLIGMHSKKHGREGERLPDRDRPTSYRNAKINRRE